MVHVKIGDMFESRAKTLVNTVNTVGVMGKGIAQAFKQHFPKMFKEYELRCTNDLVKPGIPYLYQDMLGTSIINFPTKKHWRSPARIADIECGLEIITKKYRDWEIQSIAFPPLGCGNGGLDWAVVGPMMYQKLSQLDIPVEIYAPFGTSQKQLSKEFLTRDVGLGPAHGQRRKSLRPGWIAILDVVYELEQQPFASPVGRTIFQKICFIMTQQGIDTGFTFRQGSYGPFSAEVKEALTVFANANLIREEQLGKMTALRIGPQYEAIRQRYEEHVVPLEKDIRKTVDLFSRIKSTAQAEEVTTILYAARKLNEKHSKHPVSEKDLYDHILEWKKTWNNDEKKVALASSIRNLEMLGWMNLEYSESLPEVEEFA